MRPLALLLIGCLLSGCGYYSLTGATIPDDIQTVAVPLAELDAATPIPTLADDLTRLVIDRLVRQTRLDLEPDPASADAVLDLRVTRYRSEPAALGSDDRAQLTRVTLSVEARYARQGADTPIFERSFTSYADYDPVAAGPAGEDEAAQIALGEIADDVFTAATSDW
jgi:outer membrane lipopolysaccharide assembly protein LptE/RlpB